VARNLPEPTVDELDLVAVLQALGDPVRLTLAAALSKYDGPATCSVDSYEIGVSASTLSHHWRVLREAGVTRTEVQGRRRLISLRRDDLDVRFPGLLDSVLANAVPVALPHAS
jgi:DNA-binding transcriptional ArsR family regulator